MYWRVFLYVACLLAGALAGWFAAFNVGPGNDLIGLLAGALVAALVWFVVDSIRGAKLLSWLRIGDISEPAVSSGLWGEVSDRARRLLKSRERLTQASDERLQNFLAALQASPNGVVLLDSQMRIEWFNQTASMHFGFEALRDREQHFGNLVRDPGFAAYFAARDFERDVIMPGRADSTTRPVRLAVRLHPYSDAKMLLLSRDITAVEQAEAMRRDFVANVSHEIRTPLTVLAGFVETLQTLSLDEADRQRYLDLMARQSARMQTLVSDLLTLSRLEGSPPVGSTEWVSAHMLMQQVAQEVQALTMHVVQGSGQPHLIRFEETGSSEIAGASSELLSAMANLAGNAVRYTPPGGEIIVRWRQLTDERGEFSVQDTGPGIAAEHIPRLTERFYRVDSSRSRDTGGTGLGLAIVKHVAQRHGAELKIESTPGKGSTFSLVFPPGRIKVIDPVS